MPRILGVDIGTTGMKMGVFREEKDTMKSADLLGLKYLTNNQ